jgi:hypothetical protein
MRLRHISKSLEEVKKRDDPLGYPVNFMNVGVTERVDTE